jgi:L-threonylcarbamoyladenylate synthase
MEPFREDIDQALTVLRKGGVILYPTDTIWGLGGDAENEAAVQRIFRIKRRPADKSFILLMEPDKVRIYFPEIRDAVLEEMHHATRPTTYILPGAAGLASSVIAADGSVAVRLPHDDFCQSLLRRFGKALVSTSANFAGASPPAHFGEIDPLLIKESDYVIRWRQNDRIPARPSRILRILPDGSREIIRE